MILIKLLKEKENVEMKEITPVKTPPGKRNRDNLSPSDPSHDPSGRSLKQPKLTIDVNGSPRINIGDKSPSPRSRKPESISGLLQKFSPPTALIPKSLVSKSKNDSGSPFSLSEKKSFFQNRIGSPVMDSTASSINCSFADRIDLHMCNRNSTVLDSPEVNHNKNINKLKGQLSKYSRN